MIYGSFSAVWKAIRTFKRFFSGQVSTVPNAPNEISVRYTPPAMRSLPSVCSASAASPRPVRLILLSTWFACPTLLRPAGLAPLVPFRH